MIEMIKICGLTDRAAVDAAIEAGVDAIGFVFAESVRQVTPAAAMKLCGDVPQRVRRVAVMRHPTAEQWRSVNEAFRPDVLQTDAADFATLNVPRGIERWPVYREGAVHENTELPAVFLFEGRNSGSGTTVNWQEAARLARRARMILAGGLSAGNVAAAIREVRPWGVDASSAVESAPGRKDPRMITAFVQAARDAH